MFSEHHEQMSIKADCAHHAAQYCALQVWEPQAQRELVAGHRLALMGGAYVSVKSALYKARNGVRLYIRARHAALVLTQ